MKVIGLLCATALFALGCDDQDPGGDARGTGGSGNQGSGGSGNQGSGGSGNQGSGGSGNQGADGGSGGATPVESCVDAACGAPCLSCSPNDPQCQDPSYPGFCIDGICLAQQPACGPYCGDGEVNLDFEECDDGNQADGDGCTGNCTLEHPCFGKPCGASCLTCPPNQPRCLDPSYQGYCDLDGACITDNPTCQ
jgi:cysteine-rich repeat protein